MSKSADKPCPEEKLQALVALARTDAARSRRELDRLLADYPRDPRLQFLNGSWCAERREYLAARQAMRQALDLAPDFALARFQLGLLELTCGEAYLAQETWGPLHGMPKDSPLRLFVTGLGHLIRDEFGEAIQSLETGITRNQENPALNGEMQLVIDEIKTRVKPSKLRDGGVSSVGLLLQQAALKTRH